MSPIFGQSEEEKRREEAEQRQRHELNLNAAHAEAERPMDRAYSQKLPALDDVDKTIIEQFIMGVISRATRGKDGWQQEMFNKTITASETREVDDGDDGGFL